MKLSPYPNKHEFPSSENNRTLLLEKSSAAYCRPRGAYRGEERGRDREPNAIVYYLGDGLLAVSGTLIPFVHEPWDVHAQSAWMSPDTLG